MSAAQDQYGLPFYVFCAYTFILIGRPQDYVEALRPLRLALVFTLLSLVVTVLYRGAVRDAVREPESKLYFAFYAAMILGIPFSLHRRVSFDFTFLQYIVNIIFFVLFVVHVNSVGRLKRISVVLLLSVLVFTFFGLQNGQFIGGRYTTHSRMFDPNDVAFVEVSLLAFALWILVGSFGLLIKVVALATLLAGVLLTLYTASRGGLLGILTFLLFFLWFKVPRVGRSFKAVLVGALLIGTVLNWNKINIERYMTLTSLEDDYNFQEQGRADIWTRGVKIFLSRPLTGVGVLSFPGAIGRMRAAEKNPSAKWQAAHSAYIQVLTETGLFGSVAFVLLVFRCLRTFNRLRRRGASFPDKDFGMLPGFLLTGFVAQLVSAAFLSQAYAVLLTLMFATSAVVNRIAREMPQQSADGIGPALPATSSFHRDLTGPRRFTPAAVPRR